MQDILSQYSLMVSFLGSTLSDNTEVYLLDVSKKNLPVIAQCHGHHHTLPQLHKLVQEVMGVPTIIENGMVLNRPLFSPSGKMSKGSLYFIKEAGQVVGVLCLVVRLQALLEVQQYLQGLIQFDTGDLQDVPPCPPESLHDTAPSLNLIEQMTADFTPDPQRLTPDEKTELLLDLYDTGVFELKGAVAKAAEVLQMSEQSIYRYLSKIRRYRE